jgi:hypothetical protein
MKASNPALPTGKLAHPTSTLSARNAAIGWAHLRDLHWGRVLAVVVAGLAGVFMVEEFRLAISLMPLVGG